CFFFSSRRLHTRFSRDWSSDVCSSDLVDIGTRLLDTPVDELVAASDEGTKAAEGLAQSADQHRYVVLSQPRGSHAAAAARTDDKIGRASCGGSVEILTDAACY